MKQRPSRLPYKKYQRFHAFYMRSVEKKNFMPIYGSYGIRSLDSGKIIYKQIEACRRTIRRGLGKSEKLKIRLFTHAPITKKSLLSRMGKGKGKIDSYFAPIMPGQILFEILQSRTIKLYKVLRKASRTLPVKTNIVKLKY